MFRLRSLRQKVTIGYTLLAAVILSLSVFGLVEISLMEQRVLSGERIDSLYDTVLELRRFEKNYFLYHQQGDLAQHRHYVEEARRLLTEQEGDFIDIVSADELALLQLRFGEYSQQMQQYAQDDDHPNALAAGIRENGKVLHDRTEQIARAKRAQLRHSLSWYRTLELGAVLVVGVLVVAAGRLLYSMVARPLREMEQRMEGVAIGSTDRLLISSTDSEWQSLTRAFNHVLEELEARRRHLVRSEKLASLGTLLSGVAHELNNPLSNISTSCQILLEEEAGEEDPALRHEMLTQIDEQTVRARNIVRSLLDFTRDRAFQREPILLREAVQETVRFLRGQLGSEVEVVIDIPEFLIVFGDKQRLQQAFLNLLKNAAEAVTGQGVVRVHAARRVADSRMPTGLRSGTACKAGGEVVDIEVSDTGAGIPAGLLPRIFDPFFTTKPVGQGSGLGLAVVHEIIEEHDGCISVDSRPGAGTTFHLRLPAGESSRSGGNDG